MADDMVMRSVYLRPTEDSQLRQLAHELNVTKSDLIRSAISVKLRDWLQSNSRELVLRDLVSGQRESVMERPARATTADVRPAPSPAEGEAKTLSSAKASARSDRSQASPQIKPQAERGKAAASRQRQPESAGV